MPQSDGDAIKMAAYEDELARQALRTQWTNDTPKAKLDPNLVNMLAAELERVVPQLAGGEITSYQMPRVQLRGGAVSLPPQMFSELALLETSLGAVRAEEAATSNAGLEEAIAALQQMNLEPAPGPASAGEPAPSAGDEP